MRASGEEHWLSWLKMDDIFKFLPVAGITFDSKGIIRHWNKSAESLFGWNEDEIVGKHWTMLVPAHAREHVEAVWSALMSGEIRHSINANVTKEGKEIICVWHNMPIRVGEDVVAVVSLTYPLRDLWQPATELLPDGVAVVSLDGEIFFANESLCKMLGYSMEQLHRVKVTDFVLPEDMGVFTEKLEKLIRGEELQIERLHLKRSDGSLIPCLIHGAPIRDITGNILAVALSFHDITLLSEKERETQRFIKRLQLLREIDTVLLSYFSLEESMDKIVDICLEQMGAEAVAIALYDEAKRRCELFTMKLADGRKVKEEVIELDEGLKEKMLNSGEVVVIDHLASDGRVSVKCMHRCELNSYVGVPIKVRRGIVGVFHTFYPEPVKPPEEIEFAIVVGRRISIGFDNIVAFSEAVEHAKALQSFMEAQLDVAMTAPTLLAGEVLKWLRESLYVERADFYAYDEKESVLRLEASIGFPSYRLNAVKEEGVIKYGEGIVGICASERRAIYVPDCSLEPLWKPFAVDAEQPIRSAYAVPMAFGEKLFGVIVLIADEPNGISSFKRNLADLFAHYVSAGMQIARLLAELKQAYEELQMMQRELIQQEKIRTLGQMASGIAHDINNVLVPILGYAELLCEMLTGEEEKKYATAIYKAVQDLSKVVERLRAFYKRRLPEEEIEPVDLKDALLQAVDMTKPRWYDMAQREGTTIEFKFEFDESLPPIAGVGSEVREAVVNLILNAVDAIIAKGNGHGVITLRTGAKDGWAFVEVEDDGIGMDEETKERALEPFFTTKADRGTGLGLPMVYGIMQRHEGLVEIESELGVGTKVRLLFPMRTIKEPVKVKELLGEIPPLKILLIDDDVRVLSTVKDMLTMMGHEVDTADSGERGLEKFMDAYSRGESYRLVITDLGMPKVSGIDVLRKVKELSPTTPVIVLSGWGRESIPKDADGFVAKPPRMHELRTAIADIVKNQNVNV